METIEKRLCADLKSALLKKQECPSTEEMVTICNPYIKEINNLNFMYFAIIRRWDGGGTWKMRLWVDERPVGKGIAKCLNSLYHVTYDEDTEYTIEDFSDDIKDELINWAFDKCVDLIDEIYEQESGYVMPEIEEMKRDADKLFDIGEIFVNTMKNLSPTGSLCYIVKGDVK